jgi:hypothetical protein
MVIASLLPSSPWINRLARSTCPCNNTTQPFYPIEVLLASAYLGKSTADDRIKALSISKSIFVSLFQTFESGKYHDDPQ